MTAIYKHGSAATTNCTYNQSFVEFYNYGSDTVDLTGYYLLYSSSSNFGANSDVASINYHSGAQRICFHDSLRELHGINFKIAPGKYFLFGGGQVETHPTAANLPVSVDLNGNALKVPYNLSPWATGSLFVLSKFVDNNQDGLFDTIYTRDFETPEVQENVIDALVYGTVRKWGGVALTGGSAVVPDSVAFTNCFSGQFDTIVTPAASLDLTKLFVRKKIGDVYSNTGVMNDDWEKIPAEGYEIHNSQYGGNTSIAVQVNNNVSLFPNPTSNGTFTVNSGNITKGNVFIYNVTGKLVGTFPINSSGTRCDVSEKGLYFVSVVNAQGIVQSVKKLVF
jgi:hypothetical protein